MLVLSRHVGERILITGDITITVVRIEGDKVRLGFEAPDHIVINREELEEQLNRQAGEKP